MSTTTPNLGLFKYNTTTDSSVPFNINTALNANWDILDERCGSQRNIGEIVASTVPLTDAGLHLLDGSLIQGGGIYSAFVNYMVGLKTNYPDLFCSEATWQESVTNYGVCGKFVHDSTNNTIRLPKITGILEGTTDLTAIGDLVEAGLPNITGGVGAWANTGILSGAFEAGTISNNAPNSGSASAWTWNPSFDASRSSSIYGNSSTVQPQTIKVLYYIVIATSTKTDIQVDIDEIATDLNGKCDKADLQECQVVVETYLNGTSWYRIWSDGWGEQGGIASKDSTVTFLKPFSNSDYSLVISYYRPNNETAEYVVKTKNYNNFTTKSNVSNADPCYWYACGYIGD